MEFLWRAVEQTLADMSVDTLDRTAHVKALLDEIAPYLTPGTPAEARLRHQKDLLGPP